MHSFLKSNYFQVQSYFNQISTYKPWKKKKMHPNAHLLNFWVGSV